MARSEDADARAARWEKGGPRSLHAGRVPSGGTRPGAAQADREPSARPAAGGAARRDPGPARPADREQRTARGHAQGGAGPDRHAQGGGRPPGAAAERVRRLPDRARGRHGRRLHRRPQAAGGGLARGRGRRRCAGARRSCSTTRSTSSTRSASSGPARWSCSRRSLEGGDRALVISHADEERVVHLADTLARLAAAGRRLAADRAALGVRLRADPEERGRGARAGGGARHRLHRHRRPGPADRADPRRGGAAVPARRAVPRAPAAPAEGRAALRPARLRQDAHRQGGGQLAGEEDRRAAGRRRSRPATSSTSRVRSCSTSTSARPSGTSG